MLVAGTSVSDQLNISRYATLHPLYTHQSCLSTNVARCNNHSNDCSGWGASQNNASCKGARKNYTSSSTEVVVVKPLNK
jgi:hypothetical protein